MVILQGQGKPYKVCGISFSELVADFGEFVKQSVTVTVAVAVARPLNALHWAQLPTRPRLRLP